MNEQDFCNRWDFAIGSKEMRLLKDLREHDFTLEQIDIVFTCMTEYAVESDAFNVLKEKDYEEVA